MLRSHAFDGLFDGQKVGGQVDCEDPVPAFQVGVVERVLDDDSRAFRHDVVDRDLHAFACEQLGDGSADALSRSGHQGALALPTLVVMLLIESIYCLILPFASYR